MSKLRVAIIGAGRARESGKRTGFGTAHNHVRGWMAVPDCEVVAVADIVTVCASRHLREAAGKVALLQGGAAIPVFALTGKGKEIILEKIRETDIPVFIKGERLPVAGKREPEPLI